MFNKTHPKNGFTLTELAIVIGILGMILGAIWSAAGSVYSSNKINKATQQLEQIIANMRSLYASAQLIDTSITMINAMVGAPLTGTMLTYIQAGVFPNDALNTGNAATATITNSPWSNGIIAIIPSGILVAGDAFDVSFSGLPKQDCVKFVKLNMTTTAFSAGLAMMWVGPSGSSTSSWSGSITAATLPTYSDPAYIASTICTNNSSFVGFGILLH